MQNTTRRHDYRSLTTAEAVSKLREAAETTALRQRIKPHEDRRVKHAFSLLNQPRKQSKSKADRRREDYRHFLQKVESECGPELIIVCALGLGQTTIGTMRESPRLRLPNEIRNLKTDFELPFLRNLVHNYYHEGFTASAAERTDNVPQRDVNGVDSVTDEQTRVHTLVTSESSSDSPIPSPEQQPLRPRSRATAPPINPPEESPSTQQRSLSGKVFALTHEDARAIVTSNQIASGVWMTEPYDLASLPFITIPITQEACLQFGLRRWQVI